MGILTTFFDGLRQLARRLSRTPMFTAITLITLAVGIGANIVIFSVVDRVLLEPLAYPDSDRLVSIRYSAKIVDHPFNIAPSLYFIDREQSKTLESIGAYDDDGSTVTGSGGPEHVYIQDVNSGTLAALRAVPSLGRLFTDADDAASAPPTVVLSYAYWQKKYGGDPSVVGRNLTMDSKPRQIVGVLGKDFHFLDKDGPEIFIPFQWDRSKTKLGNFSHATVARLRPGVTLEQATADLARLIPVTLRSFPAPEGFPLSIFENAAFAPVLTPLKQELVGDIGKVLWVLMGSIVMVLLIACANVANLLLVRVEGRRQELAIRAALGAGWRRIAGDLLFESLALGMIGSLLGLGLAKVALLGLVALAPAGLPRINEIGINLPVLLFSLGVALFTSLLIGAIPVLRYAGAKSTADLREGGRGQSQSREQHRTRNGLVVLQIALALVLLICSGLMIRTFQALSHVNPGFDNPNTLQTIRIGFPDPESANVEKVMRTEQAIRDKIAAIPGVQSVAMSNGVPLSGDSANDPVFAQDKVYKDGDLPPLRRFRMMSPGYLATMGTPLLAGRDFTWNDHYARLPVAIVSENLAREIWQNPANALGKRIRVGSSDDWREVVGVVANTYDDGVSQAAPKVAYWPMLMSNFEGNKDRFVPFVTYAIRTDRSGTEALIRDIERAVWSVDSNIPLVDSRPMSVLYKESMGRTSFTLIMLSVAGAMALLLGVVGIYGVISYSVTQRTREIGIRMALGAQRAAITQMFVRHGLILTAIGVVVGLGVSFAAMRLMSSLLFHVSPADPLTYGTITLTIAVVAWLSCYLPSRRAATVDPVHALRSE